VTNPDLYHRQVTYLVIAFVLVVAIAAYVAWTAGRLDRLQARCLAARSALDAQLVRRAAAGVALAHDRAGELGPVVPELLAVATRALEADELSREAAENDLTRCLRELPWSADAPELADVSSAGQRMTIARHIYNDAVRDTLALRGRRVPRALRLGSGSPRPEYFDIDDSLPGLPVTRPGQPVTPSRDVRPPGGVGPARQ